LIKKTHCEKRIFFAGGFRGFFKYFIEYYKKILSAAKDVSNDLRLEFYDHRCTFESLAQSMLKFARLGQIMASQNPANVW
jgi:hypothetical protein